MKNFVSRADFAYQFKQVIIRHKRIGYDINVMRQSAYLVINPITIDSYADLFNGTPVGRASGSMRGPTSSLLIYSSWLGLDIVLSVAWSFGVQLVVFFCSGVSVDFSWCHNTFLSSSITFLVL